MPARTVPPRPSVQGNLPDVAREGVGDNALYPIHFLVAQFPECPLAPFPRERAAVLADKHDEVFRDARRDFDGFHDAPDGLVVAAQVVDFAGQVVFNRALYAGVQQLCGLIAVEVPVEVGRVVEHLHVALRRWTPSDEGINGPDCTCSVCW